MSTVRDRLLVLLLVLLLPLQGVAAAGTALAEPTRTLAAPVAATTADQPAPCHAPATAEVPTGHAATHQDNNGAAPGCPSCAMSCCHATAALPALPDIRPPAAGPVRLARQRPTLPAPAPRTGPERPPRALPLA